MFYSPLYGTIHSTDTTARADASEARANAREARLDVQLMEQDISRLLMITEALWTFLKKAHGYSDEDLAKTIKEIDLRDGIQDGRSTKSTPVTCAGCGRINSGRRTMCIYCGKPMPLNPFGR